MKYSEKKAAVLSFSFDDGRADAFAAYRNILAPLEIPATFNIPTGCIDGTCDPVAVQCGDKSLSLEELRIMASDPLAEIASHGDRHNNRIDEAYVSLEKLRLWLGEQQYGFASPGSGLRYPDYLDPKWQQFSYLRVGPVFRTVRFLRIAARKIARVIHIPALYRFAYGDCIMTHGDERILYAVPILKTIHVSEVKELVRLCIRRKGSLILMLHGILDSTEGEDNWAWESGKLMELCTWMKDQESQGNLEICTTRDLAERLRNTNN